MSGKSDVNPLGIDIGGSGIKGAPVDLKAGAFAADRFKLKTPKPSTPEAVADTVAEVAAQFGPTKRRPVGITIPAVVMHGTVRSAANIDKGWIGCDAETLLSDKLGCPVFVVNDGDAAGQAEAAYGAAKGVDGVVIMTTLGTGIGTALINNGVLVPNTELGHLEIDGVDAESRAASRWRDEEDLSWEEYAQRLNRYYEVVEFLLSPDLIVIGGGISKDFDKFGPLLKTKARVVPAELRNAAGIIGAAMLAEQHASSGRAGKPATSKSKSKSKKG